MSEPPLCAAPDPHPRKPENTAPPGACDCHFHVFDEPSPQIPDRKYTAPTAPLTAYRKMQSVLGLDRAVIVQPSIYGTDNRTTMLSMPDDGSMKAIVVVDENTDAGDLQKLADNGAVGARFNVLFSNQARTDGLATLAHRMADLCWHLQVLTDVSAQSNLLEILSDLPVPVVFDHMGHVPTEKGVEDPGFQTLLRLLDSGNIWVKLSGVYRVTGSKSGDYGDVAPMAKALVCANPDRMIWGSDWPHPAVDIRMPNDADLFDLLFDWAGSDAARKILVDNPEQLYGFPKWEACDER